MDSSKVHLAGFLLICVVLLFVEGRGVDVGLCGETHFDCSCGPESNGYKINIPVKQCTFFYRWKPYCKPCKDIKKETLCAPYGSCLECNNDRCTKCPPNRYGQWCTGVCQCQNGATCSERDGSCTCAPGFVGVNCEIKIAPSCPAPEAPLHGNVAGTKFDVGATVTYSCEPGYALVGQRTRTCAIEQSWSGHIPTCERLCPMPSLPADLVAEKNPFGQGAPGSEVDPEVVRVLRFSCQGGYHLSGVGLLTCLPSGAWDQPLPQCKKQCTLPKSPENGYVATDHANLLEGSKVIFRCNEGYLLVGQSEITCSKHGNWSHPTPLCELVSFCPDPGEIEAATREVEPGIGGEFSSGTIVTYRCMGEALLLGRSRLECHRNGTWSYSTPTCVLVRDEPVTCATTGAAVVREVNIPVRITCPDGCSSGKVKVWGSIIYKKTMHDVYLSRYRPPRCRIIALVMVIEKFTCSNARYQESQVCASAIHAGMIPPTGGGILVVNNGVYNTFFSTNSNGIKSSRHRSPALSFRFNFVLFEEDAVCPEDWTQHGKFCAVYIDRAVPIEKAEAICHNLASELMTGIVTDEPAASRLVRHVAPDEGPERVWFGKESGRWSDSSSPIAGTRTSNSTSKADGPLARNVTEPIAPGTGHSTCAVLDPRTKIVAVNCSESANFVCRLNATLVGSDDVVCDDPKAIAFGSAESEDTVHGVYVVGSMVTFRCDPLYHLKGAATITCTGNGTWSDQTPACIKVPACRDPIPVKNGMYTILPAISGGPGTRPRSAVVNGSPGSPPRGLSITFSANSSKPEVDFSEVSVPAGYHRTGSRVQFTCESRYYNLVGSSTRTCMPEGHWSGRQPTCQPVCGISSSPRAPFIVNGKPTKVGQWPWQVGIARRVDDEKGPGWFMVCGGAVLTESWMITAAHCVTETGSTTVLPPDDFRMYFGKYHRNDTLDDQWVQVRRVKFIHVFPDFNPVLYDGDLALVELDVPIQLTSRVQPVCLPDTLSGMSDRHLQAGTIGVVTGWGVDENQEYSSTLLQADVPIVGSKECEDGYQKAGVSISVSGRMFCAGFKEGGEKQDACSGDSGGPFVMSEGAGVHERWYLEGVVSWGSPFGCGIDRQYGGYTKVAAFLDWIQQFI